MFKIKKSIKGFSRLGFLLQIIFIAILFFLVFRAGPSVIEYFAIDRAASAAKFISQSPDEIRAAYDRIASTGFIKAIKGSDLIIYEGEEDLVIQFEYQKKINLFGPLNLLIDYRGSTGGKQIKDVN
tara:strand:- start:816 stop:1193 length:378 start_codon:yes stop_codon:yes gene_type:complete